MKLPPSKCDLVIVGGGPAGIAAGIYAASEGLNVSLIEVARTLGGQAGTSSLIVNYLGFPDGISGKQLAARSTRQLKKLGANVIPGRVTAIGTDGVARYIQMDSGHIVSCKTTLIACGVQWRHLDVPGIAGYGVFYGSNPSEVDQWSGKVVAIIGGANSAGQAAVHFAKHGAEQVIVLSRSPLEKSMFAYLIHELKARGNVEIVEGAEVDAVKRKNSKLTLSTFVASRYIEVDAVFIFIGAEPQTEWLDVVKDTRGFILTGQELKKVMPDGFEGRDPLPMETSVQGIFAARDVRSGSLKRVSAATGEGAAAVAEIHQYLGMLKEGQ